VVKIGLEALTAGLNTAWHATTEWNMRDLTETYECGYNIR